MKMYFKDFLLLGNQVQFLMRPLFQAEHLDLASMLQKAPVQANLFKKQSAKMTLFSSHILRIEQNVIF